MNRFNKKLKDTTAVEREKLVLDIELQDQTAPANWTFNGQPIESSERYTIKYSPMSFNIFQHIPLCKSFNSF